MSHNKAGEEEYKSTVFVVVVWPCLFIYPNQPASQHAEQGVRCLHATFPPGRTTSGT